MRRLRVLIVDDDPGITKLLRASFGDMGYELLVAIDGVEALHTIQRELPDIIILDIKIPKIDGLEVCRQLREWSQIPIIMLSADSAIEQKVRCLDLGADDYVVKPFSLDELMARVRGVLRRTRAIRSTATVPVFTVGDLQIDFARRQVTSAGNEIRCTPIEYSLLQELVLNVGKVLTHAQLLNRVWGQEYGGETEYLRVFVNRLRTKIEPNPTKPRYISTVPGVGYMFSRRKPDQNQILVTTVVNERHL